MAEENPFANAMRPDKGGLPGFIGGMMGVKTTDQAQGSATGSALAAIANLRSSGKTTQQAAMEFFKTPEGQDFFTNAGPDGIKNLASGLSQMQPPSPTMNNIAPGGMLTATDQNGNTSVAASNPQTFAPTNLGPGHIAVDRNGKQIAENTNPDPSAIPADVRSFSFFSQLAKLPEAERRRLAGLKADPTKGGPNSVMSEAVDTLVKDYGLDTRTAEALKGGFVKILPLKNALGQDTGAATVIDLTQNPPSIQVLDPANNKLPAAATPNAGMLPGSTPDSGASTGVLPQTSAETTNRAATIPTNNPKYFGDKSTMFLASGPIAKGLAAASGMTEMVDPTKIIPEGAKAADRQQLINTLRSDLSAMGRMGESTEGGGGWVNKGVLEGYLKLAPSGKWDESPHQAIQKAIRLSEHVQQEIEAQTDVYNDKTLPIEQRKKAQSIIQGWQRVQRDLPLPDELSKMEKAIREGTAGAPTISGAVKEVTDVAGKALTSSKKEFGKVQQDQGLTTNRPNIDAMSTPQELLSLDPRTLNREEKIKYLRKIDALKKGNGKQSSLGNEDTSQRFNSQYLGVPSKVGPGTSGYGTG